MKKLLYLVLLSSILFSCKKEIEGNNELKEITNEKMAKSSSSLLLNGTIIPLDSTKFPKKANKSFTAKNLSSTFQLDDPYSVLYQLNGIPFYIKTLNTYLGNNTFSTNGQGQEVTIKAYNEADNAQLFYFQFLPASTGIPYLIRSFKEGTPIGAGSYASNPNNYVLYTQQSGNSSLFGFSWNLLFNTQKSAYYIENQDLLGQGPGGFWDIYNYALQAQNGQISFVKRNDASFQQFNIVPKGVYKITEVVYDYDNAEIIGQTPLQLRTGEHQNVGYTTNDNVTLALNESTSASSSFKEASGFTTTYNASANASFSIPGIFSVGGSASVGGSTSTSTEYSTTSTRTISFTETYSFQIPPRTISRYTYFATKYNLRVNYRAKCVSLDNQTSFYVGGVYEGVDCTNTYVERQLISMDNLTAKSVKTEKIKSSKYK